MCYDYILASISFFAGFFFSALLTMGQDERRKNNYMDFRRRNATDKKDMEQDDMFDNSTNT